MLWLNYKYLQLWKYTNFEFMTTEEKSLINTEDANIYFLIPS